jgi:hypothetical protein
MKVLLGCEESQAVCIEFRKLGHEAYSCDLKPCSGGHPEWHLQMDVFEAIRLKQWDLGIFFPDCTFLTGSGLHWNKRTPGRAEKTEKALQFVCDLMNCPIPKKAFENPVGCIGTRIFHYYDEMTRQYSWKVFPTVLKHGGRKPDQIIQPHEFGDDASKKTCIWVDDLPLLQSTGYYPPRIVDGKKRWSNQTDSGQNKLGPSEDRAEIRSKTYPGIARAMATQWG